MFFFLFNNLCSGSQIQFFFGFKIKKPFFFLNALNNSKWFPSKNVRKCAYIFSNLLDFSVHFVVDSICSSPAMEDSTTVHKSLLVNYRTRSHHRNRKVDFFSFFSYLSILNHFRQLCVNADQFFLFLLNYVVTTRSVYICFRLLLLFLSMNITRELIVTFVCICQVRKYVCVCVSLCVCVCVCARLSGSV